MLSKSTKREFCLRQMLPHPQAPHPADTPTSITKAAVFAIEKLLARTVVKPGKRKGKDRQKNQNPVHIDILITEAQTSLSATYCKDCGTYIDSVEQGLAKSLQAENPWVSKAEQVLLDSVSDHEHLTREQAIAAAKQMTIECEQLEPGDYKMLDIATMFVDCGDRAIAASDVHMNTGKRTTMMFSNEKSTMPERGTTKLRVVDPYEDEGIWAIVDEGANSNTHSDFWMKDAEKKWAKLGFSAYLKDATTTTFSGVGSKASSGKCIKHLASNIKL